MQKRSKSGKKKCMQTIVNKNENDINNRKL